jgi:hypothetical protein
VLGACGVFAHSVGCGGSRLPLQLESTVNDLLADGYAAGQLCMQVGRVCECDAPGCGTSESVGAVQGVACGVGSSSVCLPRADTAAA